MNYQELFASLYQEEKLKFHVKSDLQDKRKKFCSISSMKTKILRHITKSLPFLIWKDNLMKTFFKILNVIMEIGNEREQPMKAYSKKYKYTCVLRTKWIYCEKIFQETGG